MAPLTQSLDIRYRICAAFEQRFDMIDLVRFIQQALAGRTAPLLVCCYAFLHQRRDIGPPRWSGRPLSSCNNIIWLEKVLAKLEHAIRGQWTEAANNQSNHEDHTHCTYYTEYHLLFE